MIKHIVMWRLKDFAEGASREENAKKLKETLEGLKDKISEIREVNKFFNTKLHCFSNFNKGYQVVSSILGFSAII